MISRDAALPATAPPAGTLVSDAEDEGSVSGDGGITKSNIQGPHCPPHHCPDPASAEVCGDEMTGTWRWRRWRPASSSI